MKVNIKWIEAEALEEPDGGDLLDDADGILVPGGFGDRGTRGMMKAAQIARERGIPYFGICYGFQWATVEYARNVAGLPDADSTECAPDTPTKVIYKLRDLLGVDELGGTMRLGSYACELAPGSLAQRVYGATHRFTSAIATATSSTACTSARSPSSGLRISGRSPDGKFVEIAEVPDHPWYVAVQFHPEFKSKPTQPHPLFAAFVEASYKHKTAGVARPATESVVVTAGVRSYNYATITFGGGHPFVLIAGPCVIESEGHATGAGGDARRHRAAARRAVHLQGVVRQGQPHVRPLVPRPRPRRGPARARRDQVEVRCPDPHRHPRAGAGGSRPPRSPTSCRFRRSCRRQTDLLVAAARTGRIVNIKKGQFLAPDDMKHAVAKVVDAGNPRVIVTERGTSFGYHNLVVDMRAFPMMREQGVPVVFDVTHSLQLPGGGDGVTAGLAQYIEPLASAGVAAGVDGVFLEVHEDPARARSDAQNALRLDPSSRCSAG